jgi:hypothetical protein
MIVVRSVLLSVVLYGAFIALSRWLGFTYPAADWIALGLCLVSPLLDSRARAWVKTKGLIAIAIWLSLNGVFLLGVAFWVIATLFGEGL